MDADGRLFVDIVGLRRWVPNHAPGGGSVVYCIAGVCDASGKFVAKRKAQETPQARVEKEVRWTAPTMVFELDRTTAFVRIKVFERRFRKREVGSVTLDLSHYSVADRVERWFRLVPAEAPADAATAARGELRLRIRFGDPPFKEDEWHPSLSVASSPTPDSDGRTAESDSMDALSKSSADLADASLPLVDGDDEPNVAWVLLDMTKPNRNSLVIRLNRLALNVSSKRVNTANAHWLVCYAEASRGVYVSQRQQSYNCTMVIDEAFEVSASVPFVVISLHCTEERSVASVSVSLASALVPDEIASRWYPLRQATNYVVPSSSGSFGRFPAVGSGAFFRVLDATKLLGHELPNGYSALAEPVAPPVAEWRHWRLAVLATALLLLLAVNVIRL